MDGAAVRVEVFLRGHEKLLRASRAPYWDVVIEHGVEPDGPVVDVSQNPGRRLPHLP